MEALGDVDLATQRELTELEQWQRGLGGSGQLILTVIGTANSLSQLKAKLQGYNEFHFTQACKTRSIRKKGVVRLADPKEGPVFTSPRAYATGPGAQKALYMKERPNVFWRVRKPPEEVWIQGPRPVAHGTGLEFLYKRIRPEFLRGPYPVPLWNAFALGAEGAGIVTGFLPGNRQCACKLEKILEDACDGEPMLLRSP